MELHTELAAIGAPRIEMCSRPASTCTFRRSDANNNSITKRAQHSPCARLQRFIAHGFPLDHIAQLAKPIEAPGEELSAGREGECVVLAEGHTKHLVRERTELSRQ